MTTPRSPRHLALAIATAAGCLAVLLATLAIAWSWRTALPDPVAVHWSGSNSPDGFGSLASVLAPQALVTVVLVAAFCAIAAFWGRSAQNRRVGIASAVWITLFMAAISLGTLAPQRGLADAAQAAVPGWLLPAAIAVPLAVAAGVACLVPGDAPAPAATSVPADAPRVDLAASERAVWVGHTFSKPGLYIGTTVTALTLVLAVVTRMWGLLIVPAILVVLLGAMTSFVTTVDASGLSVRSSMGWPRTHVPAAEVVEATAVDVRPLAQFGGWGWRVGRGGRVGIVPRKGRGVLVRRTGDRSLVVVVDCADQAAALLNTFADRARARAR